MNHNYILIKDPFYHNSDAIHCLNLYEDSNEMNEEFQHIIITPSNNYDYYYDDTTNIEYASIEICEKKYFEYLNKYFQNQLTDDELDDFDFSDFVKSTDLFIRI